MNMTIARIAPKLVITAPNNAERWPPEKKFKLPNPLRRVFIPGDKPQEGEIDEFKGTGWKRIYPEVPVLMTNSRRDYFNGSMSADRS
uniref:hypothetical protein n=1 Tax=Enterobacter sp. TaxID=42895 RepID=UPI00296E2C90|nr:hypothetical protein [Enterobacter sp.]